MAELLTAGITRDRAFELLNEHNKDRSTSRTARPSRAPCATLRASSTPRTRSFGARRPAARLGLGGA
ncbi:MAG: hypothetical protein ACLU0O_01910 [Collinsella sp.]